MTLGAARPGTPGTRARLRAACRAAFRASLRVLPSWFRERAGGEMQAAFDERLHESTTAWSALRATLREVGAVIVVAVRLLLSDRRPAPARRRLPMLDLLRQDLAYGARALLRRPGTTALVVLTFGLGIAATTAMFSVVDAVLLRPLPYPDADRIVRIHPTLPEWRNTTLHHMWDRASFSHPEFVEFERAQQSYEIVGVYGSTRATLLGAGAPERLQIGIASGGLLPLVGARPVLGRLFDGGETRPVIVLTHELWQRRFGGDSAILGRLVQMSGVGYEVVGVLPREFDVVGLQADAWRPVADAFDRHDRNNHNYRALGRLRRGIPVERASEEAERLIGAFSTGGHVEHGGRVVSLHADLTASYRLPLLLLAGAAFVLLAAASASAATMLLGLGIERESEMAVRSALGASRGRIVGHLLVEGALLGAAGGALGIGIAGSMMQLLLGLAPSQLPRLETASLDLRVLGFAVATSVVCAILFALAPAWIIAGANLGHSADASRVTRRTRGRLQHGLVIAQVALATVLLIGAGLLTRTMQQLTGVDPGFDPDGLVTVQLSPDYARLFDVRAPDFTSRVHTHFATILDAVGSIPGLEVAVAGTLPYTGDRASNDIAVEGYVPAPGELMTADRRLVSANHFSVMRMRLVAGRGFTPGDDRAGAPRVVVVNESLARRFWPGRSALGGRIRFWNDEPWTVVGVVADPRERDLRGDAGPTGGESYKFYVPGRVLGAGDGSLVIRTALNTASVARVVRERIWAVDSTVAITEVRMMSDRIDDSIAEQRYRMVLTQAFSILAAVFAIMGVHGVLSSTAARRRREMGVRAALGARYVDLLGLILRQGLTLTGAGLAGGLLISALTTRVLESMLYGTRRADPLILLSIPTLLLGLTLLAAWRPARRAAMVDPAQVLRSD